MFNQYFHPTLQFRLSKECPSYSQKMLMLTGLLLQASFYLTLSNVK